MHLDLLAARYVREGNAPAEARRLARAKFGGVAQIREELRDQAGFPMLESWLRDVRHAARGLRRNPGFSLVVVLTLGVGVGANAAVFSFVNAVLLQPLPYVEADRLAAVQETNPPAPFLVTPGDYVDWRERNEVFETLSGYLYSVSGLTTPAGRRRAAVHRGGVLRLLSDAPRAAPPGADVPARRGSAGPRRGRGDRSRPLDAPVRGRTGHRGARDRAGRAPVHRGRRHAAGVRVPPRRPRRVDPAGAHRGGPERPAEPQRGDGGPAPARRDPRAGARRDGGARRPPRGGPSPDQHRPRRRGRRAPAPATRGDGSVSPPRPDRGGARAARRVRQRVEPAVGPHDLPRPRDDLSRFRAAPRRGAMAHRAAGRGRVPAAGARRRRHRHRGRGVGRRGAQGQHLARDVEVGPGLPRHRRRLAGLRLLARGGGRRRCRVRPGRGVRGVAARGDGRAAGRRPDGHRPPGLAAARPRCRRGGPGRRDHRLGGAGGAGLPRAPARARGASRRRAWGRCSSGRRMRGSRTRGGSSSSSTTCWRGRRRSPASRARASSPNCRPASGTVRPSSSGSKGGPSLHPARPRWPTCSSRAAATSGRRAFRSSTGARSTRGTTPGRAATSRSSSASASPGGTGPTETPWGNGCRCPPSPPAGRGRGWSASWETSDRTGSRPSAPSCTCRPVRSRTARCT